MSDAILEMRNITKNFPGVKVLKDVSLNVERGKIHAICGENGAGKSTLMKLLRRRTRTAHSTAISSSTAKPHALRCHQGFRAQPASSSSIRNSPSSRPCR